MKIITIIIILVVGFQSFSLAQSDIASDQQGSFSHAQKMISFVPQYLGKSGLRIDYDLRLNHKHWLQFAPTIYLQNNEISHSSHGANFNHLIGSGLHIYHRFYPENEISYPGIYISWGGVYQYYVINYNEQMENSEMKRHSTIQKVGGDVIIGINTRLIEPVLIDFYAGMGLRHSFLESDALNPKRFDELYSDYGYTGNILILGIRISLPF